MFSLKLVLGGLIGSLLLIAGAMAGPQVEIPKATVNFGRVTQNQTLVHKFWIKSVGDDTLRITMVFPGCACTQMPLEDSTIAPGDSTSLGIVFSTGHFKGLVHKEPSIKTNVSNDNIRMSILAEVLAEVESARPLVMRPALLDVSQFTEKTRRQGKFHIQNYGDEDLHLVVLDSAQKSFEIKLPNLIKAGETVEGRIRVRDNALKTEFDESLTIRVDGEETNFYTIPIRRRYRPEG